MLYFLVFVSLQISYINHRSLKKFIENLYGEKMSWFSGTKRFWNIGKKNLRNLKRFGDSQNCRKICSSRFFVEKLFCSRHSLYFIWFIFLSLVVHRVENFQVSHWKLFCYFNHLKLIKISYEIYFT